MRKSNFRTDLAKESAETFDKKLPRGVFAEETAIGNITKTVVEIKTESAEKRLLRKKGRYITLEGDFFYKDELAEALEKEIKTMLTPGKVMVAGLGNLNITPDSLGPLTAEKIMATSHLKENFRRSFSLESLRDVSVIFPGSSGQTGIETASQIKAVAKSENISSLVLIDALAARSPEMLGRNIQVTDAGISPGSGVGNRRSEISFATMGIPCIAIGVPTVASAFTISGKSSGEALCGDMLLTPKDIDIIIKRSTEVLSEALNYALQEKIERDRLKMLI